MAGQPVRYADKNKIAERIDFTRAISVGPNQLGFDEFFGTAHQGIDHVVIDNSHRVPQPDARLANCKSATISPI